MLTLYFSRCSWRHRHALSLQHRCTPDLRHCVPLRARTPPSRRCPVPAPTIGVGAGEHAPRSSLPLPNSPLSLHCDRISTSTTLPSKPKPPLQSNSPPHRHGRQLPEASPPLPPDRHSQARAQPLPRSPSLSRRPRGLAAFRRAAVLRAAGRPPPPPSVRPRQLAAAAPDRPSHPRQDGRRAQHVKPPTRRALHPGQQVLHSAAHPLRGQVALDAARRPQSHRPTRLSENLCSHCHRWRARTLSIRHILRS